MKKTGKRLGALLLALVMVLSLVPGTALAARAGDDEIAIAAPETENFEEVSATKAELPEPNEESAELLVADDWVPSSEDASMDYPLTVDMVSVPGWDTSDNTPIANALDGNANTFWGANWHSSTTGNTAPSVVTDNYIRFDLPDDVPILAVRYKGRAGNQNGRFTSGKLQTSSDGQSWTDVKEFTGWANDDSWKIVTLDSAVTGGFLQIVPSTLGATVHGTAAEIRLVMDKTSVHEVTGTVQTTDGTAIEGATITLNCLKATSGNNGVFTLNLPNGTYSATLTKDSYQNKTVEVVVNGQDVALGNIQMKEPATAVTGTVTYGEKGALEGATVTLVTGTRATCDFVNMTEGKSYSSIQNAPTATTGNNGTYSLNMNGVENGTYRLRISKDGYGAKLSETDIVMIDAGVTAGAENNDVVLDDYEAVDTAYQNLHYSIKTFDFASGIPDISNAADGQANAATASHDAAGGRLKLSFTSNDRTLNLLRLADTPMKNGEVEFDVTRSANEVCFGLGLRVGADKAAGDSDFDHWLFVGQFGRPARWGYEYWNKGTGNSRNVWSKNYVESTPTFAANETRHIKVRLENTTVNLWVDGIHVVNNAVLGDPSTLGGCTNTSTPPTGAGDIGFLFGSDQDLGGAEDIYIDNLRVIRFDPAFEVESGTFTDGSVTITTAAPNAEAVPLPDDKRVPEGDTVIITGKPNAETHALGNVTATETSPAEGQAARTLTATRNANGTFSFSMPAYNVTLSGAFLPKVESAAITAGNGVKVNKTITAAATVAGSGDGTGITYKWYYQANADQSADVDATPAGWTEITNPESGDPIITGTGNNTLKIPSAALNRKIKAVATGDGEHNTGTAEKVTDTAVAAADIQLTGVNIQRTVVNMVANGDPTDDSTEANVGKTTVLTANITPTTATDPTFTWKIFDAETGGNDITNSTDIITLADVSGAENKQKVTANNRGTVWVQVEAGAAEVAENATTTDRVKIVVTNKLTGITVKNGGNVVSDSDKIIIYANSDTELTGQAGKVRSVTLTAERNPADATDALTWEVSGRPNGLTGGGIQVARNDQNTLEATVSFPVQEDGSVQSEDFKGKLGEYKVKVKSGSVEKEVTFELRRFVNREISIGIQGVDVPTAAPKYGQTLSASINNLAMSDAGKAALKFEWFALDAVGGNAPTEIPPTAQPFKTETGITGESNGKTITLDNNLASGLDLIGKYIAVQITAEVAGNNFYEGSKFAIRGQAVAKADGPAAPSGLSADPPAAQDGTTTIKGLVSGTSYEYRPEMSGQGPDDNWAELTSTTAVPSNKTLEVRVKGTTTQEAGAIAKVTTPAYNDPRHSVSVAEDLQNGSLTVDPSLAAQGTEVTITLTPAEHYEVDTVTVSGVDTVSGTGNTRTFSMPDADVTVSATFKIIRLTIDHSGLEHIKCSEDTGTNHPTSHEVDHGATAAITLVPEPGYTLPAKDQIHVYNVDNADDPIESSLYSINDNGTITFDGGVVHNLKIVATGVANTYDVTRDIGETLSLSNQGKATHGKDYITVLSVVTAQQENYELPDAVTVKRGDTTLTLNTDYEYSKSNGTIKILAAAVTGNLTISATAKQKVKTVTAVTISGSAVTGQTLTVATVTPNVAVTYKWQRGDTENGSFTDISNATKSTYVLTTADLDKYIRVAVTAVAPNEGTNIASNAIGPVAAQVIDTDGITLDKTTASIVFGKTETLTATVTPTNASDKTVTWRSSDEAVATVENGVVTAKKVGTATITATNSGGQTAQCAVTVTPAPLTGVTLSSPVKVGVALTATAAPAGATATYRWFVKGAEENAEFQEVSGTDNTYTPVADDAGKTIKVVATGKDNYGESVEAVSSAVLGENVSTYTVTITPSTNGNVIADKTEAPEGDTIILTATPDEGYKLGTLTVKDADNGDVTVTDNAFAMPAKNVTVTATFVVDSTGPVDPDPDKITITPSSTALANAGGEVKFTVALAEGVEGTVAVTCDVESITITENEDGTFSATLPKGTKNYTFTATVTTAGGETFTATCSVRVRPAGGAISGGSTTGTGGNTTTETKEDGTTVTTTKKHDGSVTQVTESPDGTKETVETKADGTVTETVETPDGVKEVVETKPDGTVTETVTDAEGAKTEKVTTPEKDVTITVTGTEGEKLAEVTLPAEIAEPETKFEDVPETHWAEKAINNMASLGVVNGVGDNKYGVSAGMTRGDLATVLYRLSNGQSNYEQSFRDVASGKYYADGVAWAAKVNVVKGVTETEFAPENIITREQLAVMLTRYAKLLGMDTTAEAETLNTFADSAKTGAWAMDGVAWCVKNGILQGKGQNTLDPTTEVSRAEVAMMLDRFIALISK